MIALTSIPSACNDCTASGVTITPSTMMAIGARIKKDMIVKILNKLILSRPAFPAHMKLIYVNLDCSAYTLPSKCNQDKYEPFSINFFDKTFLDWNVILDPNAAKNPVQLNVNSDVDANATPVTIGTKDAATGMVGTEPRKMKDMMTLKNGSKALTVCVKETATALKDTLVNTFPRTWIPASGETDFSAPGSIFGRS